MAGNNVALSAPPFSAALAPPSTPPAGRPPRRNLLIRLGCSAPVRLVVGIALCLVAPPLLLRAFRPLVHLAQPVGAAIQSLLATAVLLLAYTLVVRALERRPVTELARRSALRHLTLGAATGALAFGGVFVLLLAVEAYEAVAVQQPLGIGALMALLLYLAFLEEVVFRGLVQRILEEGLGTWLALIVSNLLFALAHVDNFGATALSTVSVGLAGLALGLLFVLTRSLWWPMAAHFAWNATQVAAGASVSGHNEAASALLRLAPRGEAWLTGGEFGPEGSVATLVVLLALVSGLAGAAAARRVLVAPRWRRRRIPLPPLAAIP